MASLNLKERWQNMQERGDRQSYVSEFDAICIDPQAGEGKYPAKQHARKVAKNLGVSDGVLFLLGRPSDLIEDSDQEKTFRQRRYFFYLSGVDFEDCIVVYDIRLDELSLFVPEVNARTVIWVGATPSKEQCLRDYDVDKVYFLKDVLGYAKAALKASSKSARLYALHDDQAPQTTELKQRVDSSSLMAAMDSARVIKTDYEVGLIRRANDISSQAHEDVLRALAWATNETQLEAVFIARSVASSAKRQAYGVIAASGANASTLHYMANDQDLEGRELVCLDAGCEWTCYASDVTRTFPISGTFSKESQAIYSIVQKMQDACIAEIRPGKRFGEVHVLAMKIAAEELLKLGVLCNGTVEELLEVGAARLFFPHGLGHHLGLEVHDVSGKERLLAGIASHHEKYLPRGGPYTGSQVLQPNMVITIEPGIYFNRYAMEEVYFKDPKFTKYIDKEVVRKYFVVGGVRIEDDVLVTPTGHENLTKAAKGEEACEIIRNARKNGRESCPF